jgi:hypothetical protein
MYSLLKQDPRFPAGWRPKRNLLAPSSKPGEARPGHYRYCSNFTETRRDTNSLCTDESAWKPGSTLSTCTTSTDPPSQWWVYISIYISLYLHIYMYVPYLHCVWCLQRGFPYDDISRWRVFKDPRLIDIVSAIAIDTRIYSYLHICAHVVQNLLPAPVLEEEKKEEKKEDTFMSAVGDIGSFFGFGSAAKDKK